MDIAVRLKHLRKERGFSQYSLAKRSGVSQSFISSIEKNDKSPTIKTLEKLCLSLGISLAEFFSENKKVPPDYMEPLLMEARFLTPKQIQLLANFLTNFRLDG